VRVLGLHVLADDPLAQRSQLAHSVRDYACCA
jgi:hypothetical protein